ncbi:hypothetical protein D3C76_1491140 [compost metagenome]
MGHVDHPEQAEGDGQAERGQQQDRAQRQATEGLAEQFADQQLALDLGQAGFGRGAYGRVALGVGLQQGFEAGAGQRVTGFAEQANGGQAYCRFAGAQLQVGQGQAEGGVHGGIRFAGEAPVEEGHLRRLRAFL